MQDPVMRASEAELCQNLVRIANEVPVCEKQEFDQVERCRVPLPGFSWDQMTHRGFEIYVSHVDIFLVFCYGNEGAMRNDRARPLPTLPRKRGRVGRGLVAQYRSHRAITISGLDPRSKSGGNHQARQLDLHMN